MPCVDYGGQLAACGASGLDDCLPGHAAECVRQVEVEGGVVRAGVEGLGEVFVQCVCAIWCADSQLGRVLVFIGARVWCGGGLLWL